MNDGIGILYSDGEFMDLTPSLIIVPPVAMSKFEIEQIREHPAGPAVASFESWPTAGYADPQGIEHDDHPSESVVPLVHSKGMSQ